MHACRPARNLVHQGVQHVKRPFFSDDAHLAYAHGASNVPLIGATIGEVFDRVAESQHDRDALVSCHQGLRYTYSQLKAEVDRFARGLIALGIQKGERLGIWSPNHAEWIVTQYATAKIGAILVNINPAYRVHELEYALKQSGCASVIIAPPFKTTDYAALLGELYPELSCTEPGRLRADRVPDLRRVIAFGAQQVPGAFHWDDLLTMGGASVRASIRRPDQHPVHVRDDRLSKRRNAVAPLDPEQCAWLRRLPALHGPGPAVRHISLLPLRRHGPEQPVLCRNWGRNGAARPGLRCRGNAGGN